ncbi:hypothetical protein E2C01_093691 [Portunus trituberculatus]|uniref:Uncharacterized protein n=1 Tax=Portunus trituberculatus TaxID=210409 RepID=A0A5B7JUV3_PORTR|nr:hypothetical protein [Portunus trituberculatus]
MTKREKELAIVLLS